MNPSPNPDLIKITEIFLVPSSFLVAALGTADTNPHRAAVSLLGFLISGLWWRCSRDALTELAPSAMVDALPSRRVRLLHFLSVVFALGWAASTIVHLVLWQIPLGT